MECKCFTRPPEPWVELYLQSSVVILSQPPDHSQRSQTPSQSCFFFLSYVQLVQNYWFWSEDQDVDLDAVGFSSPQKMERCFKTQITEPFTLFSRTTTRPQTFYDGSHPCARGVCHIPMAEPFCPKTREVCNLSGMCTKINHEGLGGI